MQRRSEFIDALQKANKTKTVKVREKNYNICDISSDHRLIFLSTLTTYGRPWQSRL
jgi:c-di-AMP phosphodiesterase-like protein